MVVATSNGDELQSAQWFLEVPIIVSGRSLPADLRVLNVHDEVFVSAFWLDQCSSSFHGSDEQGVQTLLGPVC